MAVFPVDAQENVKLALESAVTTVSFRKTCKYCVVPPPENVAPALDCSVQPDGGVAGVARV